MYRGCPSVWGASEHVGHSNMGGAECIGDWGHLNVWEHTDIWGHLNVQGVSKHTGGIQTYRGYLNVLWYLDIQGHPNVWGCPNMGAFG